MAALYLTQISMSNTYFSFANRSAHILYIQLFIIVFNLQHIFIFFYDIYDNLVAFGAYNNLVVFFVN